MIPGLGRSPGGGKDYPFQYSGLENPMDYSGFQALQTEKPGRLQSMGGKESDTTEQLSHHVMSISELQDSSI